MPILKIDNREVEVPPGATVLEAAQRLGIDIPTLCYREGCEPSTSCLVCMVKMGGNHRLVPSCGTVATEGMVIESETEEVHQVRRSALELLLSDHLGDCLAPCWFGCPANMDIPKMLRQIAAGDLRGAIATVKADIALPAVLGRICPAPCEKVCRRAGLDGPVAICLLKRYVADTDLVSGNVYLPPCRPSTGKRVAVLGGGPTGLSAVYYLAQQGHAVTVFDENEHLGGRLRRETSAERLPVEGLDAEIATITALGIEVCTNSRVGSDFSFSDLPEQFDAVLIAGGASAAAQAESWGLPSNAHGIVVNKATFETSLPAVFAAGNAIRSGKGLVVRSVADGKEAAVSIGQFLAGQPVTGPSQPFSTKIGRMEPAELVQLSAGAEKSPRREATAGFAPQEAAEQAARCLHCDCRALSTCRLRKYAAQYHADPRRYKAERRRFSQDAQHGEVIFEPGKCIDCGLCIQIAAAAGERLGLTFIGRGFNVRVGVPLGHGMAEALAKVAAECIAACPTAALAWNDLPAKSG
jgi:NADPH-dependent glutamate synthase beta subunit-like oxidoreductase